MSVAPRKLARLLALTMCVLSCVVIADPAPASAQEDLASVERAHELYQRGLAAYQIGDYEVAVNAFLASWSMYEDPRLLYNLSLAYWKLGKLDQAIATATRVVEADVEPGVHLRTHARRAAFRTILNAQSAASEVSRAHDGEVRDIDVASSPRRGGPWRWVPWTTAAVTLGAVGGAAVVDRQIAATATKMKLAEAGNDRTRAVALHAEIERRQLVGRVLLATVAVGATATVVLFVIRPRSSSSPKTRIEVGFLPTRVTLSGRF